MSTADRTYTFRASSDLVTRMESAVERWQRLSAHPDATVSSWVTQEFERRLLSTLPGLDSANQSAFLRGLVESFLSAVDKVALDLELAEEYAKWAEENDFDREWSEAALRAAADRWRED